AFFSNRARTSAHIDFVPLTGVLGDFIKDLERAGFYSESLLKGPKSNQKVLAPPLGASLRLGMPAHRLESVGRRDGPSLAQRG
ncbi:hypothetical protein, partial [Pseudomonas sp. ICMP 460]|uniref:hypothetical protein n=1 Tax=Pseudomonas sp. ICMP 460 TaxID=1718917 RepID=UPI001C454D52